MAKNQDSTKNQKNKKPWAVLRKGVITAALSVGVIAGGAMLSGCSESAIKWHYGTEDPTAEVGKVGDFYLETDDNDVWVYGENGWINLKGLQGEQGVSVTSIAKTGTEGLVDTYTSTYSNGTTTTFTVTNGAQGLQGIQGVPGASGHTPVITIQGGNWYVDGVDTGVSAQGVKGDTGIGISDISKTGTEGLVDTYTITYTNGTTTTFTVTNGAQGVQGIQGVPGLDGHTPVITIENGNWFIDGVDSGKPAQGEKGETGRTGFFVNDVEQLKTALGIDNTYLVLMNDIWIDEQLEVENNTVLDLNGHTIYCGSEIWNTANKKWSAVSVNGGSLLVKGNGTIQTNENDCYAFDIRNDGTLIIEDGRYVGNISAVYVFEGNLKIYGGTYEIQQLSEYSDYRYLLNCEDNAYRADTANITVYGGKFVGYNPKDNLAETGGANFVAEGREAIEYEDHGEYKIYKVVDPTDETIESYWLSTEAIALKVSGGKLVEEYGNNFMSVEKANGTTQDIYFDELDIDLSGFKTANTVFDAKVTYENVEATIKVLPIENIADLDTGVYQLNASVAGQQSGILCELNGEPVLNDTYLYYGINSTADGMSYNYQTNVTKDMLVGFDNATQGVQVCTFDEAKTGCAVGEAVTILVYDETTAQINYYANADFKVGEGSYDKIQVSKSVQVGDDAQGYAHVAFDQEWLDGKTIDFDTVGEYVIYASNIYISVNVYDPEVCNVEYLSFNHSFNNLEILKGATPEQIETFIAQNILNSSTEATTGTAYFYEQVGTQTSEQFALTRSMIDLSRFSTDKVGESVIVIKYVQQAGYVDGKTVAYEHEIYVDVTVDMNQATLVGEYNAASTSMIPSTMGYTAIALYDNGCAYLTSTYSPNPHLVEYTKEQIGETNKYIFAYYESSAGGYIYFELTDDATNGNTFDHYVPTGTVANTYTVEVEGMPLTVKVYGTEGTCYAVCELDAGAMDPSMAGFMIHYATTDFTYNQDGTVEAMGVVYEVGAGNVLTPKA